MNFDKFGVVLKSFGPSDQSSNCILWCEKLSVNKSGLDQTGSWAKLSGQAAPLQLHAASSVEGDC